MVAQKKQLDLFDDDSSHSTDLPLSTVGKMLQLSPQKFIKALADRKMIFKRKSSQAWEAYQTFIAKGLFRHYTYMIQHNSGEFVPHIQVKVTPKGYQVLKELFKA